ncbi:MAG: hypothetical protein U0R71_11035 [Solirubrobacterales bacterium]
MSAGGTSEGIAAGSPPAADDLVHEPEMVPIWRESYHFGFGQPGTDRFGYATFGKRPLKGRSGFLIAFWDPDQGFLVGQEIDTFERLDDEHDVAGLKARCVRPFEQWEVSFEGELVKVPRLSERRYEEARAVVESEREKVPVSFEFTWRALTPAHAYEWQPAFRALFDGRHEQPGSCEGELSIGGERHDLSGWNGIRDHAWGARSWDDATGWRWISATFATGPHLSLLATRREDGEWIVDGGLYDESGAERIVAYRETVEELPAEVKPEPVSSQFTVTGESGRELTVTGAVLAAVPIRFATEQPRPGVNWNDRCIARFAAPHGSGVGELEFGALVPNEEAADE